MEWSSKNVTFKVDPSLHKVFGRSRKKHKVVKPKPKPKPKRKPMTVEQKNKVLKGMGLKPKDHWREMFKKNFGG